MNRGDQIKYAAYELIEKGNLDVIETVFSADYIAHAEGKIYRGHEFIKRFSKQLRTAIPDMSVLKVEIHVEKGDRVAWQRTLQGTHQANMLGLPPSKQKIIWNEMLVSRFERDKIAEEWVVSDLAGQLLLAHPAKKINVKEQRKT